MTIIPTSDAINETTVMRQIRKLADCIDSRDGGMISSIDFDKESNTYVMVITFADGTSQRFEWDTSPIDISSMTGSVSNGNLTVTIFMSNGTSHAFTCPLNGMATESYVDTGLALKADTSTVNTLDAQNVKKTGTSVVIGDIQVPTTPANPTSVVNSAYVNDATEGVNNIVHKSGNETVDGAKLMNIPVHGVPSFLTSRKILTITGTYRLLMKISKSIFVERNHIEISIYSRLRAWKPDRIMLYMNFSTVSGFIMMDRGNTNANITYVASSDDDYVYILSVVQNAGTSDDLYVQIDNMTGNVTGISNLYDSVNNDNVNYASVPGTEYGRLTP